MRVLILIEDRPDGSVSVSMAEKGKPLGKMSPAGLLGGRLMIEARRRTKEGPSSYETLRDGHRTRKPG